MPSSLPHLTALIKLLGDDHSVIVETVRTKLIDLGAEAAPLLGQAAQSHEDPKVRVEAKGILEKFRLADLVKEWKQMAPAPEDEFDLERGVFLLAKVSSGSLDGVGFKVRLDELAQRARPLLQKAAAPMDQILLLNEFLFEKEKFRGNWTDYFDPRNSFLNEVLDRKLGIPISLSVLYLLIGKRLGLALHGVGIPGHFMLKHLDGAKESYIDPFHEGRILSRADCVEFIVEAGYPYQVSFLKAVGSREILARMVRNLILIYTERQEEVLLQTLHIFLESLFPGNSFRPSIDEAFG